MNPFAQHHVALGGMMILIAALALSLGGISLVLYSARMTREAVSRRVDLVRTRPAGAMGRSVAMRSALIRTHPRGAADRELREVERLAAKFRIAPAHANDVFTGVRLVTVTALTLAGYLLASHSSMFASARTMPLLLATACGIGGWFAPALLIRRSIKLRSRAVVAGLPDALELLVICVEAGLAFEDGLSRVVGELEKSRPILAEELAFTTADLKILPSREQALANLAERIDAPSVSSVVTTLTQTLRYGTPLAHALRMVASELRNDTLVRLEERANQFPSLMTVPMMLFIMPTIFMIVAGPAALRLMDAMNR
jgi:tight adherence protein C